MNKFITIISLICGIFHINAQELDNSIRIIGYSLVAINPGEYNLICNPFSAGRTNGANEIGLNMEGVQIITWNGSNFKYASYQSQFNGWVDENFSKTSPPILPPGRGFFFYSPNMLLTNIVFAGDVVPMPGATAVYALPFGYSLVGSPIPFDSNDITEFPLNFPEIDSVQILTFEDNMYNFVTYESQFGGGTC